MRLQFLSFFCFFAFVAFSPVYAGDDPCVLNDNSEVTDTISCEFDALKLKYIVKDISFCTELPVPNQFDSCESWEIPEFEFEITNNSVTEVQVGSDLPRGTYTWMSLTLNPRREVTAIATFNRTMQGSSSSGKKCWTNGGTVNRGTTAYRETDRSKWTAECGDAFPEQIPSNVIIYNNTWFGPGVFVNSYDSFMPDGSRTVGYLLDQSGNFANSHLDVVNMISLHELKTPIVVTDDPAKVSVFDITYDRSQGAETFIDTVLGVNNLSRIQHGSFTVTVDHEELAE